MRYSCVSADSHINEPPDLWTSRAPASLRDDVPHVIAIAQGDAWVLDREVAARPVGTSAVAGTKPEDYLKEPVTYKAMRPGSFDPAARIEDMDIDGIDAEVLYPGIARALDVVPTPELRLFCAQAYNDWIAEFQAHDPARLVGLAILPPIDDAAGRHAVAELERAHSLGLKGAWLSTPVDGVPLSHDDAEPLWEAAAGHRMPISLHIGVGRTMVTKSVSNLNRELPGVKEAFLSTVPLDIADYVGVLLFSGVLDRHPDLRIVIAESGIGWIPWFLGRMESVFDRHRHYLRSNVQRRPTEAFHAHMVTTFQEDRNGLRLRDVIGVRNMMWASDYPHTDTTWPDSQAVIKRDFSELGDEEVRAIICDTCVTVYGMA